MLFNGWGFGAEYISICKFTLFCLNHVYWLYKSFFLSGAAI